MPEPIGSIFPSLYGDDPGEQEAAQDITGQPLPSMVEDATQGGGGDPSAVITRSSGVTPGQGGEPMVPAESVQEGAPAEFEIEEPARGKRGRTVQDRIDQLTFRVHQRGAENEELRGEVSRLTGVIGELQRHILNPAAQNQNNQNPLVEGTAGAGDPSNINNVVARAIQQHVAPLSQAVGQIVNNAQLNQQHGASLAQAVDEFPDLGNPQSNFSRTFRKVWEGSPLKELANGPYQVAMQVRGLLADVRADEKRQTAQKRAASVRVPSSTIPEQVSAGAPTQGDRARFAQLQGQLRKGDASFQTYREWRLLREKFKGR